ncbi:MAG TPA: DUF4214 domain-containing protein [Pyrinomonadaceae bacterium]
MFSSSVGQQSPIRIALIFTICAALLLIPSMHLLVRTAAQGQGGPSAARPQPGKPEGTWPDLEHVKGESSIRYEPLPPIPSILRSRKVPLQPWNGRTVGDPEARIGQVVGQLRRPNAQLRRAHARRNVKPSPPPIPDDLLVWSFFYWTVQRTPQTSEQSYWNDQLRVAYTQGQTSLKLAIIELGKTLFESAAYAARNRDNHGYVYDLFETYLNRDPDPSGWAYWEGQVPLIGRENVRRGFEDSTGFANLVATVTPNGSASSSAASLISSRVDPRNQPGNGMLARDAVWSVSLLSLPGRAGLDLGLALSYSSIIWTRSGPYLYFDEDNGFPSPGFRLGFPTVQRKVFDAQTARNCYLLITAAGHRVELRQVGTSNIYDAYDSSYLRLTENGGTLLVQSTDGTSLSFTESGGEYRCIEVKDRNGNYITINYSSIGRITNITDTLGRIIMFNYDINANLLSITQAWNGQPSHQWVSFGWAAPAPSMLSSFSDPSLRGMIGIAYGNSVPVINQVVLNDTSYFTFEYNSSLQVSAIRNKFGTIERNATSFTYETPAGDVPHLLSSSVSARNWTGVNGVPAQVTTQYSVAGDGACVMTAPDGTVYKEYYGTGWQRGLTTRSEVWAGGPQPEKWTTTTWTQDTASVGYEINPRVTETNIYDRSGNRRRTVIDYGPYAQYGLPYGVREFAADGITEIRQTYTDYNLSTSYVERRIIGLVSQVHVSNVAQWQSKISYSYDDPARLQAPPVTATQHDTNYNAAFTARGNVTSVSRWDVTDITNIAKALTSYTNYYTTGTSSLTTDPAGHQSSIAYADSFSDSLNRNTFAYPTIITDGDNNTSYVQYNFDFGAMTRTQSPAPAGQPQGAIQTMTYNNLGQLERVSRANNSAYKRFWYGPDYVASYATVNNVADELYSIRVVDGARRVIGAAGNHPGSNGGYKLVVTIYDLMGRAWKKSNPTEVNSSWVPSGVDSAGIYYTTQTYDWNGRPLVTTNTDGTSKEISYAGCGCAGGEVVTLTDEGTIDAGVAKRRQQKIYSDVLGRTVKTELLNWAGSNSVYSTTVNTYNMRNQIEQARQYAGSTGSASYQDTTFTYDGYGRLRTRHQPEQQVDPNNNISTDHTTWDYNADDTVQKLTDARGASQTFSYNARHLVTGITYTASTGITPIGPVGYGYDTAGNRTSMTDENGRADYTYDQLSQMRSESRQFNGISGSYALNYDYNLAGELKAITDPTSATVYYAYDVVGRVINVTGSPYGGVSQYASGFVYRAWGAIKGLTYGNNLTLSMSYNSRLKSTQFEVAGRPPQYGSSSVMKTQYQYYNDGALKYADDLLDDRFDRAYGYDQGTRLKEDYSGSEARDFINQTSSGTTTGPYRQSYTFDVWSNPTSRTGRFWSKQTTFTASYSNGRNTNSLWQYDADGRVLRENLLEYTYDAAGRNVTTSSVLLNNYTGGKVTQSRDGDGLEIKRAETRQGVTTIGYRMRSTVLGGMVVTELDANGQKQKTYVYGNGEKLAEQEGGIVTWRHTNPLTGSEGSSYTAGLYAAEKELDPMLVDMGFEDPYLNFEETRPDSIQLLGGNSNGQCTVEGMSWDCMSANRLLQLGVADQMVSATVYAIYGDGRIRAIWTGSISAADTWTAESSSPGEIGGTGSNGHAPDKSFAVLGGTSDSSVTVIAGEAYASTGPQNEWMNSDPDSIANSTDVCNIRVSFTGSNSLFTNGAGVRSITDVAPGYGVGFTVTGSVNSEIGKVETPSGRDTVNPSGDWTIQQWVANSEQFSYDKAGNTVFFAGSQTHPDGPYAGFRQIAGNKFTYFDFPGPTTPNKGANLTYYRGEWDYAAKVIDGHQQCEVKFHISMRLQSGNWTAHWGSR